MSYEQAPDLGLSFRCLAWRHYIKFFRAKRAVSKKNELHRAQGFVKRSLELLSRNRNHAEFATTYDQLATVLALCYDYSWNPSIRRRGIQEAVDYGRQAIVSISSSEEKKLLSRILARAALFIDLQGNETMQSDGQDALDQEAIDYWRRAEQLDDESALLQAAYPPPGFFRVLNEEESTRICNEGLRLARGSGDNFAIGWQLDHLSGMTFFNAMHPTDNADRIKLAKESLRLAEEAEKRHGIINFVTPNNGVIWHGSPYAEHFMELSWFQTDIAKKRVLVEKSAHETEHLLRLARLSGWPRVISYSHHVTSKVKVELAELEVNRRRRKALLREALYHRQEHLRITDKIQPQAIHFVSTSLRYLADIQASIADLETDHRKKLRLYQMAAKNKERGLRLNSLYAENVSKGKPHLLHRLVGKTYLEYGDLLDRLYRINGDEVILEKTARAYTDATTFLKNTTAYRGLGEGYWKAGQAYDQLQAHTLAAENFDQAAKIYQSIAETNPQLGTFFFDCARYSEAWSNIERARGSRRRQAHDESEKYYQTASDQHKVAGRWNFLAPYYTGLARVETAEHLSKLGRGPESVIAFREAAQIFSDTKLPILKHSIQSDAPEEKTMSEKVAASFNESYCLARGMVEEARIAEAEGDHLTSVEKFRTASEMLEGTAQRTSSKRERKELLHISSLARAWSEMAQRTIKTPETALLKAAKEFEKSMDYCADENARNLSLGNRAFCQALLATDRFARTLYPADYENAAEYFTIASGHFASAGYLVQSTHAQSFKMLLDAQAIIAEANMELDSSKKARSFQAATETLNKAAEGFGGIGQTATRQQVLDQMKAVESQQTSAGWLAELSKTSDMSQTIVFSPPVIGEETPIGHSKFTGSKLDIGYGPATSFPSRPDEEATIEVRVVNVGTQPISVLRLENIVPEGVRVVKTPSGSKHEGGTIGLEPRSIDPMNAESFQITVRSSKAGPLVINPQVFYSDEAGRELSHVLPSKVLVGSPVLDHLVREFVNDNRSKRLALNDCGWRTLTSIVESLKIPRSHLYGDQRWGRRHGPQLQMLLNHGLVESRVYSGEPGRGGSIIKIRLAYDQDPARQYADELTR